MPKLYINGKLYLNGRLCNGSARYNETEEERKQYKLTDLRQLAKKNGIKGVSKLNKEPLCQAIKDFFEKDNVRPPIVEELVEEPVEELVENLPFSLIQNSIVESIQPLSYMKINGTTISSISGPVSFYYFRPTNKLSKLPLIMLFGDYHRARNKMCKKCSCSKETKSCCYKISDPDFLQLFDTLASKYPIDFYTETSFTGTGKGFENGEMEILTTGDMTSCYHDRLRDTKYDTCPTRNIRWHPADLRQASEEFFNRYISKLNSSNTMETYKQTSKYYNQNMYVESQIEVIFNMIKNRETLTEEYFKTTVFGSFEGFKDFIMILFGPEDEEEFNPYYVKKFARTLFDFGSSSSINKQIQKQSIKKLKNREIWVLLYAVSIHKFLSTYKNKYKKYLKKIVKSSTLKNIKEETKQIAWKIISNITIPLVEMYVLARMFKKPTYGNISSLSIGYFGDAHIQNMVELLTFLDKILDMRDGSKYKLVAKIDKSDMDELKISRCLKMPPIDLNDELLKHNHS